MRKVKSTFSNLLTAVFVLVVQTQPSSAQELRQHKQCTYKENIFTSLKVLSQMAPQGYSIQPGLQIDDLQTQMAINCYQQRLHPDSGFYPADLRPFTDQTLWQLLLKKGRTGLYRQDVQDLDKLHFLQKYRHSKSEANFKKAIGELRDYLSEMR